ncbi:hypothetical protein ACQKCU_24025 [Heyndrickxia sporothermodurans]
MSTIPSHLYQDRYWKPILHLFRNNAKLKSVFTTKYFDLEDEVIKVASLKRTIAPWSQSEKFLVNLALHLYNENNKVNLSDMDYLDDYNKKLVMEAITLRFIR